jgi:hypothetical protein
MEIFGIIGMDLALVAVAAVEFWLIGRDIDRSVTRGVAEASTTSRGRGVFGRRSLAPSSGPSGFHAGSASDRNVAATATAEVLRTDSETSLAVTSSSGA